MYSGVLPCTGVNSQMKSLLLYHLLSLSNRKTFVLKQLLNAEKNFEVFSLNDLSCRPDKNALSKFKKSFISHLCYSNKSQFACTLHCMF